jgi:multidrug efflux pump subunit AcrA (membrane-fusion protein)
VPGAGRVSRKEACSASLILAVIVAVFLYFAGVFTPAVEMEIATISQVYPYQALTQLNASGYVVAQRKAAVATKTTSRLEWLGVEEGNRVRKNEVIARLEGEDVAAARQQAGANLKVAEANLRGEG